MVTIFALLSGGIVTGRLCRYRRLAALSRLISVIIWALLFLLGAEVGGDPTVTAGFATLGMSAFVIFVGSVGGSIGAAWLLWRHIVRSGKAPAKSAVAAGVADGNGCVAREEAVAGTEDGAGSSLREALQGSLVIVAWFVAGCIVGGCLPFDGAQGRISTWVLYALMFCVGMTLGHDTTLAGRVRQLAPQLALLPLATVVGTLAGAALTAPLIGAWGVGDVLAVGAGFGYYSLSSIFIADLKGPELATVALLCNIMRELFTLLAAPLVARWAGPLAAVSIGGATTFDTTLPVISRSTGAPYVVVAIFHGCMVDFSVPFLVTFCCSLG